MKVTLFQWLIVPLFLATSGFLSSKAIQAQVNPDTGNNLDSPILDDRTTTNPGATQDNNISWWWLLPILAIPLFLLLRRGDERMRDERMDDSYVGAKGGEARRSRDIDMED